MSDDENASTWLLVATGVIVFAIVILSIFRSRRERKESSRLIFFYVQWCPHCKSLLNEVWPQMERRYGSMVQKVDCDTDPETARKYDVQSYPTIVKTNGAEKYDGDRTVESLSAFLRR